MGCKPTKTKNNVVDLNSNNQRDVELSTVTATVSNTTASSVMQDRIEEEEEHLPGMVSPDIKAESPLTDSGRSSSSLNLSDSQKEPMAFEVPREGDASLIKRHPPLRFRKLEDAQVEISQEMINFKQAEAERRRSALMSERVKSARATSARASSSRMRSSTKPNLQASGDSGIETHMEENYHDDNEVM